MNKTEKLLATVVGGSGKFVRACLPQSHISAKRHARTHEPSAQTLHVGVHVYMHMYPNMYLCIINALSKTKSREVV